MAIERTAATIGMAMGSGLVLLGCQAAPPAPPPLAEGGAARSELSRHFDLDKSADNDKFQLMPHHATFVAVHGANDANEASNTSPSSDVKHGELEFQISLKTKLIEADSNDQPDLWFAYTQQSHWQIFQPSSPFRETNYEPEAFVIQPTGAWCDWGSVKLELVGLGINHQSNGRGGPQSRSWNRVVGQLGFTIDDDITVMLRPWWRIPESALNDDNPDLSNFMGWGDLVVSRDFHFGQKERLITSFLLRNNLDRSEIRGAVQLSLAYPIFNDRIALFCRIFGGFGETLIDYDHRQHSIALGISLLDWD